jgi:hypothetical protein
MFHILYRWKHENASLLKWLRGGPAVRPVARGITSGVVVTSLPPPFASGKARA